MKKLLILTLLLSATFANAQVVKKVAVWDTKCSDNSVKPFHSTMVRGGIETAVGNTPGYVVFDRSAFDIILKEHNFERSGVMSDAEINEMGKLAGVKYVVVPEASVNGDEFYVLVKMLDVETGKVSLVRDAFCSTSGPDIHKTCKNLGANLFGNNTANATTIAEVSLMEGKYVGEVLNGTPHGRGKISYKPDDSKKRVSFEGEWNKGERVKGKIIWSDNSWYDGEMKNSYFNGYGTRVYSDGRKYVGYWVMGKRSGLGVLYDDKGKVIYEGSFRDDTYNGQGTLNYSDGRKCIGSFKDGKVHGHVTLYNAEGRKVYVGEVKNATFNGPGIQYNENGSYMFGIWENGKKEGTFFGINKYGEKMTAKYSNDKQITDWKKVTYSVYDE